MLTFAASRQTDYIRAQYASPFRVWTPPQRFGVQGLSTFADRVLREETGRGLYQHGFNDFYQHGRRMIHTAGMRFEAIIN